MAPKKKLDVSPLDVTFDLKSDPTPPSCTLTLSNSSDENVAYKIKTTTPRRYMVKPNQELLLAHATISVTVVLNSKEAQALLDMPSYEQNKDKFLVATVVVDDTFVNQITAARSSPKEVQALFSALWEKKDKDDFKNLRLGCKFTIGSKPIGFSSPTPSTGPANVQLQQQQQPVYTPSIGKPQQAPSSTPIQSKPMMPTPTMMMTTPDDDASSAQQKYKELITLLVQVTDERDRFQTSYKEASKELMALKESIKSQGTTKNASVGGGVAGAAGKSVATVQLYHLILVAIVSFMVARIITMMGM